MAEEHRPSPLRRVLAFALDWLILALWGGLLFGAVMLITSADPPKPASPWIGQAIGFATMTLPFTIYYAVCESSRWQASVGKRVVGLVVLCTSCGHVRAKSQEQLSLARAFTRNAVKFIPWECGHTLAQQAVAGDGGFPLWLWGPAFVATVGPLWWLAAIFLTGDAPYDRWVGTRVVCAARV